MPSVARPIWSFGRKLAGNLIPLVVASPFAVAGALMYRPAIGPELRSMLWLSAFPIVGWVAVNVFGFWGNSDMRREMMRRLQRQRPDLRAPMWFGGFARPKYQSLLDPHEDIGFLILTDEAIEFFGETVQVALPLDQVTGVGRRANPHTWIGIGGWIAIDGELAGQKVRMLFEPRESNFVIGNRKVARQIGERLAEWLKQRQAPNSV